MAWKLWLATLLFLGSSLSPILGQSLTHEVSSNPAEVDVQGKTEVLGEIRLVQSDPGTVVTSQGSSMSFQYRDVPIANLFDGQKDINLLTGVISDVGGINITLTGGYVHIGVSASVRNVKLGNTTSGLLTLVLPAGLSVSQGDKILVNGVQADLTGKPAYTDILCSLQSTPSNANTFTSVSVVRVGWIIDRNPSITDVSPLPDGFTGSGYSHKFAGTSGAPPYTWSVVEGSLPPNLILNSETGVLAGGVVAAGTFNFTVKVVDSSSRSSKKAFTLYLQNVSVTGGGTDFGLVTIGTSRTRPLVVKNEGGKAASVSVSNTGSSAFTLDKASFNLEPGASRSIDVTFAPPDTNEDNFFRALISISIPGLSRSVEMIGKGVTGAVPVFSVVPSSGATLGNTRVKIQGKGLTVESQVKLGGVPLSNVTWVSDQLLVGITGPHAEGSVEVSVTQSDGTTIPTSNAFTYRQFQKAVASAGSWRIPFVVDSSEFRTNLGVNNLSDQVASINISLLDSNGLLVAKKPATVPSNGLTQINNIARFLEGGSGVTGREGTLLVESNQEIRAWASQIDNTTSDPSLEVAINQGAPHVLIPSIVASEQFASGLVVLNTSPEDGQVNIVGRDSRGGVVVALSNVPIPGNGYLFFDQGLYGVNRSGASLYGPVEIEGLGGISVVAAANIRSRLGTGGYSQGVSTDSAATRVALPYAVDTAEFRTNLGINNPGETNANVTVHFQDKDGFTQGSTSTTVPPHGLTQLYDVVRLLLGSSGLTDCDGWLSLDSDRPIVAWTSQIDNTSQDPSLVVGKPGGTQLLIPSVVSFGSFKSTLVVASPNETAVSVELAAYDAGGNLIGSQAVALPAFGLLSYADILDILGATGTFGPLEINSSSGKPLLAVSRVSSQQKTGGYFEGQTIRP